MVNALPLPALDGGYLALLALEAVRRKKLDQVLFSAFLSAFLFAPCKLSSGAWLTVSIVTRGGRRACQFVSGRSRRAASPARHAPPGAVAP